MTRARPVLILPSETQTREFDPKLLMACIAAERGYRVIVGSRVHMHLRVARLPVGLYLAKDVARISCRMFSILERLGHRIVAWDEELLLYTDCERYLRKRTADCAIRRLQAFFTWGEADRAMLADTEAFAGVPLIPTGNPRMDLTRVEARGFHAPEVAALRRRFGHYILVNTNFSRLNHYNPKKSLSPIAPGDLALRNLKPGDIPLPFWIFRERILGHFKTMLPALARAFPDRCIVLRPHPGENQAMWRALVADCSNVTVIHEGNVAPWLIGADAVIHNGCTTGLEAFLLDAPVIAYVPETSAEHDLALPNDVSAKAPDLESLIALVGAFAGGRRPARDPRMVAMVARTVANVEGPMAADRILDAVEQLLKRQGAPHRPPLRVRLAGQRDAIVRTAAKMILSFVPGHKNSRAYTRHRFPDIATDEVRARIRRFAEAMDRFDRIDARALFRNVFVVEARG